MVKQSNMKQKIIKGLKVAGGVLAVVGGTALAISAANKQKKKDDHFESLVYKKSIDDKFPMRSSHTFADDIEQKHRPVYINEAMGGGFSEADFFEARNKRLAIARAREF